MAVMQILQTRIIRSLTTFPVGWKQWIDVAGITALTTGTAGVVAIRTDFATFDDYDPPKSWLRPASAFIFPSLCEEIIWRGALLPIPSGSGMHYPNNLKQIAFIVLMSHVLMHPIVGATVWPRGRKVFHD